jgi:hypothetical protein
MSNSDYHPPSWGPMVTSTTCQTPALSTTKINAHADPPVHPARQAPREYPYNSYFGNQASPLPDPYDVARIDHLDIDLHAPAHCIGIRMRSLTGKDCLSSRQKDQQEGLQI